MNQVLRNWLKKFTSRASGGPKNRGNLFLQVQGFREKIFKKCVQRECKGKIPLDLLKIVLSKENDNKCGYQ